MPWHFPRDPVVSIEQLLPQELIPGHSMPLPTHQPHRKHIYVVQVQENLIEDAVWEKGTIPNIHTVILSPKGSENKHSGEVGACSSQKVETSQVGVMQSSKVLLSEQTY